jgi:hypothetical protein
LSWVDDPDKPDEPFLRAHLRIMGLAVLIILLAPKGISGCAAERWNLSLFHTGYWVMDKENP